MKKQAQTQDLTTIERNTGHEVDVALDDVEKNTIHASPKAAYHALAALRGQALSVIEVTSRDGLPPVVLIEVPEASSDLAKAAQDFGTMHHVSIVAGGEAAEVVWHDVKAPVKKAPAKKVAK